MPERDMNKALKTSGQDRNKWITAVVADAHGRIFDLYGYAAVGMAGSDLRMLSPEDTVNLPFGAELMYLPDRIPVLFNLARKKIETLRENPYEPGSPIYPVAAFNSPGYVISRVSAYQEQSNASHLPLFSYGAVGWHKNRFRSAVFQIDSEPRQDLRLMKRADIIAGVERMRKIMPENRLRRHLERCALEYGCPAGKNFFLRRYEAPLPTSRACNARCLGCISLQQDSGIACSQNRIDFTPDPEEIAQVALAHFERVKNSVVSFGQGCEGDPLLAAHVIQPAIEIIRAGTGRGTINMNTNGSMPDVLKQLFSAGLDSVRVSMNSMRPDCYAAYFRPVSYEFADVIRSIDAAIEMGKFVSINYLNLPGFTDSPEEVSALTNFLETHRVSQIQWRNLNYDPLLYWKAMNQVAQNGPPMGMNQAVEQVRRRFPEIMHGYFNPPREKWAFGPQHVKPFEK